MLWYQHCSPLFDSVSSFVMQADAFWFSLVYTVPAGLKDCPVMSLRKVYPNRKEERKRKSNCNSFVDVSNRNFGTCS